MSGTPEKILIRSVNWLGDAIMSTPALQQLRAARPNAKITLLTHEKLADLWRNQPFIDDVIAFSKNESAFQIGRRLRSEKFTAALVFPNSPRSALEVFWARIPKRIGYARPWRNLLLTRKIAPRSGEIKMRKRSPAEVKNLISSNAPTRQEIPPSAHHVHQYLHLVAEAFGASREPVSPRIFVTDDEISALKSRFELSDFSGPILGLNPGAEYGPAKRWPKEKFIAAALELQRSLNCRWLIFGGKNDAPLATEIASAIQSNGVEKSVWNLAGKTTLRELCAALKLCRVVLTNDTGPMHLAAAVGASVVVPFGSTSLELTGPGLPWLEQKHRLISARVSCSPCFLRECPIDFRCMQNISYQEVAEASIGLAKR